MRSRMNPVGDGRFPLVEVRIRKYPGYATGYETYVVHFKNAASPGIRLDSQPGELKRDALYTARFYRDFALSSRGDAQRVVVFDGNKKIGTYDRKARTHSLSLAEERAQALRKIGR